MAEVEQNRLIDEWVVERNKHIGEVYIPQVGEYPIDPDNFYGAIMNEWVTTDNIRHYADALGDRNPLWRSEDYARRTRWHGIIAPPTFTDGIAHYCPGKRELERGKFRSFYEMVWGTKRELFQVARPGDRMRVVDRFLGFEEIKSKRTKPCREFIKTIQRTFINQREETVAVVDILFNPVINSNIGPEHPFYGIRKRRKFTDEERDAITRGYDEEKRRGAETLYWEDVVVGGETKPLVVGPITVYDVAAIYVAIAGHAVGFDIQWERAKVDFDFAWLNPEVNVWTSGGVCHFRDGEGHTFWTGGAALGLFPQIDGLIDRMICNWMGDDGFLKMLDTEVPIYPIQGDAIRVKGKVTNKSTKGDEHLVDLEVRCENQDGLLLASSKATVQLISRTKSKLI